MCVCVCVCAKLSDTKATNDAAVDEKEEENVTHTSSHTLRPRAKVKDLSSD